jgi:hypothetical protein
LPSKFRLICAWSLRIVLIGLALFVPSIVAVGMRVAGVGMEHVLGVGYVSFLVSGFGAFVVGCVGDSLFVCFVGDVDGDEVRFGNAHVVFGDLLR